MKRTNPLFEGALIALAIFILAMTAAYAQTANTATISFNAPTARVDGSPITGALTYKVYQGTAGQAKAVVGTISTTTSTITTGLLGGTTYCWQVSALEGGANESALSAEACKTFPPSPPQAVVITVR